MIYLLMIVIQWSCMFAIAHLDTDESRSRNLDMRKRQVRCLLQSDITFALHDYDFI